MIAENKAIFKFTQDERQALQEEIVKIKRLIIMIMILKWLLCTEDEQNDKW